MPDACRVSWIPSLRRWHQTRQRGTFVLKLRQLDAVELVPGVVTDCVAARIVAAQAVMRGARHGFAEVGLLQEIGARDHRLDEGEPALVVAVDEGGGKGLAVE